MKPLRFRAALPLASLVLLATLVTPIAAQQYCGTVLPLMIQPPPGTDFSTGCTAHTIVYGAPTGSSGGSTPLDDPTPPDDSLCGGLTGSATFRCRMQNGYPCCLDSGACVPRLTGNISGPLEQAWAARFASDTDQRMGICHAAYVGSGSRCFLAPVSSAPVSACMPPERVAAFFMTDRGVSGDVHLEFLGYAAWTGLPTLALRPTWGSLKAIYR